MKARQKIFSIPILMLLMSFNVLAVLAQRTPAKKSAKPPEKTPVLNGQSEDQQAAATVERLLQQSGQKYSTAGMGVWIIRRTGKNLRFFQLVLSHRSGTLVTEVIISKGKSLSLNEAAPNILRLANRLDYVKVGLDKDDDWFVRNEARLKSLDAEEFRNNLERVATAADQVYGELQPSR